MGDGETFIDGNCLGNTITGVANDTGGSTSRVEREESLDGNIHARDVECLEHNLGHPLSVDFRVQGDLSEQNGVLVWRNLELIVEGVVPDLLHIIPVHNDTVLNGGRYIVYYSIL